MPKNSNIQFVHKSLPIGNRFKIGLASISCPTNMFKIYLANECDIWSYIPGCIPATIQNAINKLPFYCFPSAHGIQAATQESKSSLPPSAFDAICACLFCKDVTSECDNWNILGSYWCGDTNLIYSHIRLNVFTVR